MARPKKALPNADGYFRASRVIAHDAQGKPIKKVFVSKISKEDAKKKADDFILKNNLGDISFEAWADKWLWEYKEPFVRANTFEYTYRATLENFLVPYFKKFKLKDITNTMVQEFFNKHKKCSYSALSKMRITLSQMFDTAIANQIVSYNPCTIVNIASKKKAKQKDTYTEEEVERIVKLSYIHRFGIYIHILIRMGLRVSELCGLRWEDINLEKGTMAIKRACTDLNGMAVIDAPKSSKSNRVIPMPQDLINALKECKERGYVVKSANGNLITPRTFTAKRYNVFFNELGIKRLTPHEMRHTVGTLLYEKCHDIYAVKAFLGHSDITVTSNIYVHENPQDLAEQLFSKK